MRKTTLLALIFLFLALFLYMLPQSILVQCRLHIYSGWLSVRTALVGTEPTQPDPSALEIPLAQRVEELRQRTIQQQAEIARLRSILTQHTILRERFPQTILRQAQVLSFGREDAESALTLDIGTRAGVYSGMAVVQGQALVGRVVETVQETSLVLLVSSPGSVIPIRTASNEKNGSLHGVGNGRAIAVFYASTTQLAEGDGLISSGLLNQLPRGLVLGTIDGEPRKGKEPGTLEVDVVLAVDFTTLNELFVIEQRPRRAESPEVP